MQIRLILLDFDGTLADTRRANTLAYVATLREAGYTLTEEEYAAKYFGMRCNEFLTRYGIADPGERERLRLRKIALYPAFFDTVRLNRPLWEFCRQFRAQGGRVWIVSTGSRANIDNAMADSPVITPEIRTAVAVRNLSLMGDAQFEQTSADIRMDDAQRAELVQLNSDARIQSTITSYVVSGVLILLGLFTTRWITIFKKEEDGKEETIVAETADEMPFEPVVDREM